MDEFSAWGDMVSNRIVDDTGKKLKVKTTGHGKTRVLVCLTAKADDTNCYLSLFSRVQGEKLLH